MRYRTSVLLAAATLALAACSAEPEATDTMAADDMAAAGQDAMADDAMPAMSGQEYANMAAASDMYEIEAAQMAIDNSENAEVVELAEMIVTDHEKSTAELKAAAQQAQPAITVAASMTAEQQAMIDALEGAGENFDQTWLEQQVTAHEKALAMVQDYAQNGDVEPLKQHASTVAGPIEMHLNRARELSNQ